MNSIWSYFDCSFSYFLVAFMSSYMYSRRSTTTTTTTMGSPTSFPASTGLCRLHCYHRVNDASLPRKLYRTRFFFLHFFLVYALLSTAQWPLKRFHRTRTRARPCINQSRTYVSSRSAEKRTKKCTVARKRTCTSHIIIISRRVDRFFVLFHLSIAKHNTT